MPEVEVGVNDITRMGLEVVGRHDILPVPTEQWIRYENIEFHPVVDRKEFEKPGDNHHIIKYVILLLQNIILQYYRRSKNPRLYYTICILFL